MRRESGLDLRLFQGLSRSVPLHRPEPPQLGERNDGGGLPAEVDHLVRLGRIWVPRRLHTHNFNRTGHWPGRPDGARMAWHWAGAVVRSA
jgi:hypothetical protein